MRRPVRTYARAPYVAWFAVASLLATGALLLQGVAFDAPTRANSRAALHFASNGNFDSAGNYVPAAAGFNLADVSSLAQLDSRLTASRASYGSANATAWIQNS